MAQIKISQLTTGTPKGTDLTPATDTTDTTQAASGTTKKYIRSDEFNFYFGAVGYLPLTACKLATTSALTATYANGTLGVGATLTNSGTMASLTIDSIATSVGNRILVKNQASQFQNGIYTVTVVGSASTNWVLTRATDYDQAAEIFQYNSVFIDDGAINASLAFIQTNSGPFTIGTTAIIFTAANINSSALPTSVNSAVLRTDVAGVPDWSASMTDGMLIIGDTLGTPTAANIIAGSGVTITNGPGSISISATGAGLAWSTIAGTTQAAVIDHGYICSNAGATTVTTPATAPIGSTIEVHGLGAAGWILQANTGQTIKIGTSTTSSAGSLTSVSLSDAVSIVCIVANTTWRVQWTNSFGLTIA